MKRENRFLWVVRLMFLFLGIFFCLGSFNGNQLIDHSKKEPEPITARELAEKKTAENWHVLISDYTVEEATIVGNRTNIKYAECYLIPAGGPSPRKIRVQDNMVRSEEDAQKFFDQSTMDGFILPITAFQQDRMLDFEDVVRIDAGRRYPTRANCNEELCWGIGFFLLSGIMYGLRWWRRRSQTSQQGMQE